MNMTHIEHYFGFLRAKRWLKNTTLFLDEESLSQYSCWSKKEERITQGIGARR